MGIFIGTSGFNYRHWEDGVFYPKDLPRSEQLEHYCRFFDSVEMNVTFYRMPTLQTFRGWDRRTPGRFRFALKGSRFITHIKRLKDAREPLKFFFERSRPLLEKTGVVLWQLPPRFKADIRRLEAFCRLLRRRRGVRHAFEFRDESWFSPEVFDLIRGFDMTVCRADWPLPDMDIPDDMPFEYIRRHGPPEKTRYTGCYTDAQIRKDAKMILGWKGKKDVYVYYNNDANGYAVRNAMELRKAMVRDKD